MIPEDFQDPLEKNAGYILKRRAKR
jgi:hypothetical protein